jgi:hypothetical protein
VLRPSQLAKFALWVQNDQACKEILDTLWASTMDRLDARSSATSAAGGIGSAGGGSNSSSNNSSSSSSSAGGLSRHLNTYDVPEAEGILREARYSRLCKLRLLLAKHLDAIDALRMFTPDVVLQDRGSAPGSAVIAGAQGVLDYCWRLPDASSITEVSLQLDDRSSDRATCVWDVVDAIGDKTYRLQARLLFSPHSPDIAKVALHLADLGAAQPPHLAMQVPEPAPHLNMHRHPAAAAHMLPIQLPPPYRATEIHTYGSRF